MGTKSHKTDAAFVYRSQNNCNSFPMMASVWLKRTAQTQPLRLVPRRTPLQFFDQLPRDISCDRKLPSYPPSSSFVSGRIQTHVEQLNLRSMPPDKPMSPKWDHT